MSFSTDGIFLESYAINVVESLTITPEADLYVVIATSSSSG